MFVYHPKASWAFWCHNFDMSDLKVKKEKIIKEIEKLDNFIKFMDKRKEEREAKKNE